MTEARRRPFYQDIDGFRFAGVFDPSDVRSALNYKPRDKDFFLVTFPKCGTTWTQQITNLILTRGVSETNARSFYDKSPFLEMSGVQALGKMRKPGVIKLHLPYHLSPMSSKAKYLYVVRNPKDTLISFYHHTATYVYKFDGGNFNDYFEIFLNGENDYGDYFDHVLGWYEHRNDPNVLFINYEDIKADTSDMVMKIAKFMGEEYEKMLTEEPEVMENVLKYSTLEHMKFFDDPPSPGEEASENIPTASKNMRKRLKENKSLDASKFQRARKGNVGGWREVFTKEQNDRMNEKIYAKMKDTELYDFWQRVKCI